jgi:hypothetical protein
MEQLHNAWACECHKKILMSVLFTFGWMCLIHFGHGCDRLFHWDECSLVSGSYLWIYISLLVIIFERKSGFFQASLKCWHDCSSALHSAVRVQIWWKTNTCSDCRLKCSEPTQMKSPTCKHLHGFWFFCSWGQVTSMNPHFHVLLVNGHPKCSSSTEVMLLLDFRNHSKTCVLPKALQKLLSTHLKVPVAFCPV